MPTGAPSLIDISLHRHVSRRSCRLPQGGSSSSVAPPRLRDTFLDTISSDYPFYDEIIDDPMRLGLRTSSAHDHSHHHTIRIYLSTASLIIVPRLLLKQWEGQVHEHCGRGALRCITVGKELLTLEEVMQADVSIRILLAGESPIADKFGYSLQIVMITDASKIR